MKDILSDVYKFGLRELMLELEIGTPGISPHLTTRALILKHLLEAEKLTFQEELSFQRSESTTGLNQVTAFVCCWKNSYV